MEKYGVAKDFKKKSITLAGNLKNKKILFIGCGDGLECIPALKKGAKIYGIDICNKFIKLAINNCKKGKFFVMDFEKTSFKNKFFDGIISINSMMYVKNILKAMKEFKRILKKDGFFVAVVPHPIRKMIKYNDMNYFVKGKKFEIWRGTRRFNYYRIFEDYINTFSKAGFFIEKILEPRIPKREKSLKKDEFRYPHVVIFKLVLK